MIQPEARGEEQNASDWGRWAHCAMLLCHLSRSHKKPVGSDSRALNAKYRVEQREKEKYSSVKYESKEHLSYCTIFVVCHFLLATEAETEWWSLAFEHSGLQSWECMG